MSMQLSPELANGSSPFCEVSHSPEARTPAADGDLGFPVFCDVSHSPKAGTPAADGDLGFTVLASSDTADN
eukprot:2779048-Prorocentrum_lima.AAC.1